MTAPAPAYHLDSLQQKIAHAFAQPALLTEALTHPSFLQDHPEAGAHNQRLEFLGDAVLQIVIAEALFKLYPDAREGLLSKRRSVLVNRAMLARLAREIGADSCLRFGKSEPRGQELPSALSDTFEAIIGAVYLDAGFDTSRRVVLKVFGDLALRLGGTESADNPKGQLQELVQPIHGNDALRYKLLRATGEQHAREYEVVVHLNGEPIGSGRGTSKKIAESEAARAALAGFKPA